ncbi:hypothetical protein Tco_0684787 [Tanacetum coccineum]
MEPPCGTSECGEISRSAIRGNIFPPNSRLVVNADVGIAALTFSYFHALIVTAFLAEVRMRVEYNVKERRRLKSIVERQGELLKVGEGEIESLKAQLA